jgi:hypothetical protein
MPIDPRIALGYQAPQIESPINMMLTAQKMQAGQQENALRQAQMENYQAEVARRNALLPHEIAKAEREARAADIEMGSKQTAAQAAYHKQQRDILATINDPQTYSAWRNQYIAAQPWAAQYLPEPEQFTPEVKQQLLLTADEAIKQTVMPQNLGGETRMLRVPTYGGAATEVAGSRATVTRSPNAAQTTVNVAAPGKKFAETVGEKAAEQLNTQLTQAQSAQSSLATSAQLAPLLNSPDFISGTLGDVRLTVAKALGLAGAEETQAYFAGIGQQVAERIKAFGAGTGLSDSDRKFAEKIAGGSSDLTPEAIKRIVRINDDSARRVIGAYNERRQFLAKANPEVTNYYPSLEASGGAPPSGATPATNAKGWVLHTDKNGNKAYVSPDGKQFEEVK